MTSMLLFKANSQTSQNYEEKEYLNTKIDKQYIFYSMSDEFSFSPVIVE